MFSTYSPRPPAPRKMPPTASASHSLETPIMMQPATILSRAEPTRRPWYSPMLTGFIQQVETPHLALTVPSHCASLLCFTATDNCTFIWSWHLLFPSLSLPQKHFLWQLASSPWLKMSHASLKKKLGFLLLQKIRKLEALTLISTPCILQIWSRCQRLVSYCCKCLQLNFLAFLHFLCFCRAQQGGQLITTLWLWCTLAQAFKKKMEWPLSKYEGSDRDRGGMCYAFCWCDLSVSLKGMGKERFRESSAVEPEAIHKDLQLP